MNVSLLLHLDIIYTYLYIQTNKFIKYKQLSMRGECQKQHENKLTQLSNTETRTLKKTSIQNNVY